MNVFSKVFGTRSQREVKRIMPLVEKTESYQSQMQQLTDEQLRDKTREYKKRLAEGATLDDLLPEAFATVREAAKRVLNTVVNSRGMDGISQYTRVVREATWWQLTLNIAQWALGTLTAVAFVLVVLDGKKKGAKK
mgnify:FL=1